MKKNGNNPVLGATRVASRMETLKPLIAKALDNQRKQFEEIIGENEMLDLDEVGDIVLANEGNVSFEEVSGSMEGSIRARNTLRKQLRQKLKELK